MASNGPASIWALAVRQASLQPGGLALAGPRERLTWADLIVRAEALAAQIASRNVAPGNRVCLYVSSSPSWVVALLALRRLDLTAVSIGDRARPAELQSLLARFNVRLVIAASESLPSLPDLDVLEFSPASVGARFVAPGLGPSTRDETSTTSPAVLHLTSGSSGTPKGVPRSEVDLLEEARNVAQALSLTPDDRFLCATPVYHSFASGLLLAGLFSGTPCLLLDRLSPATLLDLVRREDATILAGVPYVFQTLTALLRSGDAPPSLRLGISGGAHLPPKTAACFRECFGAPLVQEYGLSEAGIVSFNLAHGGDNPASVGAAIPHVELRIVDPADPSRELPAGAEGEVLVRRRFPPVEYLDNPEDSAATFTPHGVRTGDLGRREEHGCLTLTGRIKSMINVAGAKVAPREVEDALLTHPALAEAIVFATPDADRGEAVTAVVVPRDGAPVSEAALIAHCRGLLSAYKVPSAVDVVGDLPRTPSGKPDLARLRAAFS